MWRQEKILQTAFLAGAITDAGGYLAYANSASCEAFVGI